MCNYQVQYIRDRRALPITRDYLANAESAYRGKDAAAPAARGRRRKQPLKRGLTRLALGTALLAALAALIGSYRAVTVHVRAVETS